MKRMATLAAGLALAAGTAAAQPTDPDWPCVQRKVPHLSIGMMWTGPIPEDMDAWRDDPGLAELVPRLAARRTPVEEAEALIAGIEAGPDAGRAERVAAAFAGAFRQIDRDRARIVEGITRFEQKQKALSERIDAREDEIADLEAETAPDDYDGLDRLDELRDALAWDVRIYQERQRSLTYVCESPVILEKRAFALGRAAMAALEGG